MPGSGDERDDDDSVKGPWKEQVSSNCIAARLPTVLLCTYLCSSRQNRSSTGRASCLASAGASTHRDV